MRRPRRRALHQLPDAGDRDAAPLLHLAVAMPELCRHTLDNQHLISLFESTEFIAALATLTSVIQGLSAPSPILEHMFDTALRSSGGAGMGGWSRCR